MAGFGRFVSHGSCSHFLNARSSLTSSCQFISTKTKKNLERDLFPNKPRKPLTPFFKYMKIMRPSIVNEFPEYKSTKIVKEISARWALEDPEYKFKLNKEYDTEYKEYMMKVIEYEKSITPEQREQHFIFQDGKLLGKPKRPPSAFILYMLNMIKTNNSITKNKEYIKQLSIQWKAMNEQDKKHVIKNDLMTHPHENYLLNIDKCKNAAALIDYLPSNNNKILSDPDAIMNNVKVHISKSEKQNEKLEFNVKTLKHLTKNWDTVKK
ncbi:transcription factor A, mitochondrial [Vespa velutina]|uniref:transcription factor A, mitochondrial n=1 Tax=Vespa velutina TaxID=202808 RepID=UPI001FB52A01|nr:transcription factor A, mitochondrial [Vespa velutina]